MSNMSYCRFENTANDMEDCIEALEESGWNLDEMIENASSPYEARAMQKFVDLCRDVADGFEDLS